MKKLIIAFSTALLLIPLAPTFAQEVNVSRPMIKNTAPTTRGNLHDAATTTREVGKVRAETVKQRALERFGKVVHKHVRIITERLEAAVERLGNIAARLESRIEKLQSEGHDMSDSLALLAEANTSIEAVRDAVVNVSIVLEATLDSNTPREHMEGVREAIQKAKEALKDAKDALMKVLQSTKAKVQ